LLVGQPELLDILALKDLRQLNQRVVSRFHLLPLEKKDLANYVNHRLHRAGGQKPLFNSASISMLFRMTQGVPRLVNLVCQHSLVAAYSLGAKTVSPALVKTAAIEVLGSGKISKFDRWPFAIMTLLLCVIGGLIIHFVDSPDISTPRTNTPQLLLESVERLESQAINNPKPQDSIANPFVALFERWSIDVGQLYSEDAFYAQAAQQNLGAKKMTAVTVETLRRIDRPGIVWLKEESLLTAYLLTGLSQTKVTLTGSQGVSSIGLPIFKERWAGNFLYLWQPPQGFKPLKIGSKNPQLVSWLQDQLAIIDQTAERLVTGGRYTAAVADKVRDFQSEQALKTDAVLGRETIMRLNQLINTSVPRLDKGVK
jgi:general secretion pathway protein A